MWGTNIKKTGGSGGGSGELNIAYGNIAPSETDKLWVMCDEPSKIDMSNEFSLSGGMCEDTGKFIVSVSGSVITGVAINGKDIYYTAYSTYSGQPKGLYKYNLDTEITNQLSSDWYVIPVDTSYSYYCTSPLIYYNGKLYRLEGTSDKVYIFDLETSIQSTISIDTYSNGSQFIIDNNKLYYISFNGTSITQAKLYVLDLETQTYNIVANNVPVSAKPTRFRMFKIDNYIYVTTNDSIYTFNRINIETGIVDINYWAVYTQNNDYRYMHQVQINNKIILVGGEKKVGSSYIATKDIQVLDAINKTITILPYQLVTDTTMYLSINLLLSLDMNNLYLLVANSHEGVDYGLYHIDLNSELDEGTLKILFDAMPNNKWKAINSDSLELCLNPRKVLLGNSNNEAVEQTALLYNKTAQQWEVI